MDGDVPLDIDAVYSVEDAVTDLTTDKLTAETRQCAETTLTIPSSTPHCVPPHRQGDREFDGNGPCVRFAIDLREVDDGTALGAAYNMHTFECSRTFASPQSDFISAEGRRETVLFSASPGSKIRSYTVASSEDETYIETDHSDAFFAYGGSNPVLSLQLTEDTGGDESGTETGVQIVTREFQVTFENCGAPQNDG